VRCPAARGIRKTLAEALIRRALRRKFAGVHVRSELAEPATETRPTVYCSNHSTIWDFAVASFVTYRTFCQDPFIVTKETSLLPLAHWAGALGVNHTDAYGVTASIRQARSLMEAVPRCAVWIFPQGMIQPENHGPYALNLGSQR
jgi:1-acyl-sn-glycerol-3-phosphate acyltransferase